MIKTERHESFLHADSGQQFRPEPTAEGMKKTSGYFFLVSTITKLITPVGKKMRQYNQFIKTSVEQASTHF